MATKGDYALSPSGWVREQTERILETGTTAGVTIKDRPVVLLTIRGARTGIPRLVPLMRVEHDGTYVAVASKGGAREHPAWYHNITANPAVQLQDGERTAEYRARELDGDERETWWARAVDAFPDYAEYQTRTDRRIPLLVLEPAP